MRKRLILWVLLLCLLPLIPAFASHECIDIYGAELLIINYRAPTETEDGYTGDEVCSYCSQTIHTGSRIPSLREQRGENTTATPKPAEPDPTATPKPAEPDPTAAPKPAELDPTAAPRPADPDPTAAPTSVPQITAPPVTPQPDLSQEPAVQQSQTQGATSSGQSSSSSGSSSSSRSTRRRGSGKATPTPAVSSSRDLSRYPFFSERFPWRRLRMTPQADLTLSLAGELIWPQEDPASPLMMLMIPGT